MMTDTVHTRLLSSDVGAIVGGVIGGLIGAVLLILLVLLVLLLVYCFVIKPRRGKSVTSPTNPLQ